MQVFVWMIFWMIFFVNKPHQSSRCCPMDTGELKKIYHFRVNSASDTRHSKSLMRDSHDARMTKDKDANVDKSKGTEVVMEKGDDSDEEERVIDVSKRHRLESAKIPWGAIFTCPSYIVVCISYFARATKMTSMTVYSLKD